ncbi:MAG: hypothetical protein ABSA43_02085 [Candidatus Microgenomates bacterium]|jgi:hypothetical protein
MKSPLAGLPKIPIFSLRDAPITDTAQAFLPIADITDDIVLFKDGGAALVLESTSLNFGLLSDKEQEAVIFAYAGLLNSLSFSIQIVVRSQRKDISNYIDYLDEAAKKITTPKLKILMDSYRNFILDSVKKKNVLGKKFYIVVPFSQFELGVSKSFASAARMGKPLFFPENYVIKKAKITLYPRRDHLIRQAGRFGIKLRQLTKNDLVELYYSIFNPEMPSRKKTEEIKE